MLNTYRFRSVNVKKLVSPPYSSNPLVERYHFAARFLYLLESVFSREELSIDEPARPAIKRAGSAVGNSVLDIGAISCYFTSSITFP